MKNPFRRSPDPVDTKKIHVDVDRAPGKHSAQILYPDLHFAVTHSTNTIDPHEHAEIYRELVRSTIAKLAAAGALDEDTPTALLQTIRAWRGTWEQRAVQHAEQQRQTSALLLAQVRQNLAQTRAGLRSSRTRLEVLRGLEAQLLHSIGFGEPAQVPSNAELERLLHADDEVALEPSLVGRYLPFTQPAVTAPHDDPTRSDTATLPDTTRTAEQESHR